MQRRNSSVARWLVRGCLVLVLALIPTSARAIFPPIDTTTTTQPVVTITSTPTTTTDTTVTTTDVTVQPVQETPEPATIVSVILGIAVLAFYSLYHRRSTATSAVS